MLFDKIAFDKEKKTPREGLTIFHTLLYLPILTFTPNPSSLVINCGMYALIIKNVKHSKQNDAIRMRRDDFLKENNLHGVDVF